MTKASKNVILYFLLHKTPLTFCSSVFPSRWSLFTCQFVRISHTKKIFTKKHTYTVYNTLITGWINWTCWNFEKILFCDYKKMNFIFNKSNCYIHWQYVLAEWTELEVSHASVRERLASLSTWCCIMLGSTASLAISVCLTFLIRTSPHQSPASPPYSGKRIYFPGWESVRGEDFHTPRSCSRA